MTAVAVKGLSVRAGSKPLVDDVSFEAASGEWISLLGPNGAGKTTILRALTGVVVFGGRVAFDDRDARDLGRRGIARLVAFVPQQPVVPTEMTVAEYVLLGRTPHLGYLSQEGAEDSRAAKRAIHRLGLDGFVDRRLGSLSGGELQRALIARALAQEAPILLLDEPTTALDIGHQQEVMELVEELRRESALTVVATMHDLTLAAQYGDRIVLLDEGRVVAAGEPHDVLTREQVLSLYGASVRLVWEGEELVAVVPVRPRREPAE
jgi:iron complex transport system ATP-binding protein